ncbi:unnamed protein product [Rhizophagus irregularis]|nr:unnamed protein product [Rhizophagus irregularis]
MKRIERFINKEQVDAMIRGVTATLLSWQISAFWIGNLNDQALKRTNQNKRPGRTNKPNTQELERNKA